MNRGASPIQEKVQGIWIFITLELMFFSILFLSFVLTRHEYPELFLESRLQLNAVLGFVNTLILLTSSWFVGLAGHALRNNKPELGSILFLFAAILGTAFIGIKLYEYNAKLTVGISMMTNDFFMFYYLITAVHFLHVVAGTLMLLIFSLILRKRKSSDSTTKVMFTGSLYWHMVDLLWVLIYPLIYLMVEK